jgi:hypothetical protein
MAILNFTATPARFIKDTAVTITLTAYSDGTATDVGTITLGIVDAAGNTVLSAGTAVTSDGGDGTYTYDLAAHTQVDQLIVTWTESGGDPVFVSYHESVGAHLVTEAQIRAADPKLADATAYPDATLVAERDRVTDLLEQWTGRSFIPRYRYVKTRGEGGRLLSLHSPQVSLGGSGGQGAAYDPTTVISATIGGTAQTVGNITVTRDGLYHTTRSWSTPTGSDPLNVTVEYEYGAPSLVDGVDRIALILIRNRLVKTAIDDRTISLAGEFGTQRFVTEGGPMNNPTRWPEANQWISEHSVRVPIGL